MKKAKEGQDKKDAAAGDEGKDASGEQSEA